MDEPVPSTSRKNRGKGRSSGRGGGNNKESDPSGRNESAAEKLARQIFVGGLPSSITQEKFREWADETWPGAVTHVQVIYTFQERHHHARPRGFGFITFRDAGCVETALEIRHRPFGPKIVELKKAEDCRGGKKVRNVKKEQGSSSSASGEQVAQPQKQSSPSSSYPPGPAELLATVSTNDGTNVKATDGADGGSSTAAESSHAAGGESQGPVHAAGHQEYPLRLQNCPQPSQGPQSSNADSNGRRNGSRANGSNADRCGRGGAAAVHGEGAARNLNDSGNDRRVSDGAPDCSVGACVSSSTEADSSAPLPKDGEKARHVHEDSIRQLLKERWDAAIGS